MTAPGLVDTHCHVMDRAFDADREAVIQRAHQAGVRSMILVGYDLPTSRAAVDLARRVPHTWAAVGIHPNSAGDASDADYAEIADLARAPEVVAIGETGLDNYREYTPPERQRWSFTWHLSLAEELDLPVVIHNRDADADVLSMMDGRRRVRGILHCFSSTDVDYLSSMLQHGFSVSFAGTLTFKNAAALRSMVAHVPPDRLLVETDCPYLAPVPHRGERNEPAFVRDTATCLASVLGTPFEALVDQLWRNTARVFPVLDRVPA